MARSLLTRRGELRDRGLLAVPAPLLVLLAALSVQGGASFAVPLVARIGPAPSAWLRIGIAALVLLLVRPAWRSRVDRRAWREAILLGLIVAAMNTSFYAAIGRIPLGVAVTLEFWGPLALGVFGSRRLLDLVWVALAGAGIFLLTGGRLTADDGLGVAFAVGAGGFWALYILEGARLGRAWPDGRGLGASLIVGAVVLLPLALVVGDGKLAAPEVWLAGAVIALFSAVIPYTLELAALRMLAPGAFGVLMSLEPAIAAAIGFVALGQTLESTDLLAMAMVSVASAGVSLTAARYPVATQEVAAPGD